MKYVTLLLFAISTVVVPTVSGQQKPQSEEEKLWWEYVSLEPSKDELKRLCFNYSSDTREPYLSFCAQELLKGNPTNEDLVLLARKAPPIYAEYAWTLLVATATNENLLNVVVDNQEAVNARSREAACAELLKRNLGEEELADFVKSAPPRYLANAWKKFIEVAPSNKTLVEMLGHPVPIKDLAAEELLKRDLSEDELAQIVGLAADKTQQEMAADRIFADGNASVSGLGMIQAWMPEPYRQIAKARIEEIEYQNIKKRRKEELVALITKANESK